MSTIYNGETCMLCRNLHHRLVAATHKIAEEFPTEEGYARHPPSAYLCEDCFNQVMFAKAYCITSLGESGKIK